MAYLYIYAPQGSAAGPGGDGRGQRLSQCCQWKHINTVVVSMQRCLLHCDRLTLRPQPGNIRLVGSEADSASLAVTVILLVKH